MSNAAKLKKRAVELEQKKQFDKALALYVQFLQESDGTLDDVDVPLYNRVGDLLLRTGNASDALNYYEKAVDLYAERGFLNNAIALCNKVLRQSPGRASIYYKLGKISATKGFKSDAKKNFLEYADRMQKAGQIDEAFRALKEFADLCPDQDDIRLMLAEQLTKENRQDEALEQLQKLHDKLNSEGRTAEARATVDRMKSIDPEVVPRASGSYRQQKSTDLIFLDTSYEQAAPQRSPTPSAPATPGRAVSDPDLVLLTLDEPTTDASLPAHASSASDMLALDVATPGADSTDTLPLIDVGDALERNDLAGLDLIATEQAEPAGAAFDFEIATPSSPAAGDAVALDLDASGSSAESSGDADAAPSIFVSSGPLSVDYVSDLVEDVTGRPVGGAGDLFDFHAPPRSDDDGVAPPAPSSSLDPDVAFPSFDPDDMSLPTADEITSGGSLAAALGGFSPSPLELESDLPIGPVEGIADAEAATGPASGDADALQVEWPAAEPAGPRPSGDTSAAAELAASIDDLIVADAEDAGAAVVAATPNAEAPAASEYADADVHAVGPGPKDAAVDTPLDDLIVASPAQPNASPTDSADERRAEPLVADRDTPVETVAERPADAEGGAMSPVPDPSLDEKAAGPETVANTPSDVQAARATPPAMQAAADESDSTSERLAGWEVQRAHAERLLESGDRAGGVQVLEQVAAELERIGTLERALTIVDELIRLSPDSIRHHQKRVELAFRSNDRVKLIDAYLELGDALFRAGEERKARAVYQRVLELAPDDPRARAAVESVSSMSPPAGSGAIAAIPAPPRPADSRQEAAVSQPPARDIRPPAAASNGGRPGGVAGPPPSRKPAPLDRTAASNGEYVDLGDWLRQGESPKSTRMVTEEKPPTGDEQADFQEMLKRFKQGVAENVDDEDYESHYDLGVAYKEMGLIDEAVAEFQKALRGNHHRVRAYEALGQCFVEKEQYQVAASVLGRAIALGEGDDHHLVGVLYLLGRATEALNRNQDALDYYQRVFAVDIEFRDVAERIGAIDRKAT